MREPASRCFEFISDLWLLCSLLRERGQGEFRLRWVAMRLQPLADELSKALASELKDRRIARGMSMNELATKTALAVSFIGYIERGERRPSVETLVKISWALDTTAAEILGKVECPIFQRKRASEMGG
jgi:DNA-binding XRE family transcriptional regulator